jgi:hypothetical protein
MQNKRIVPFEERLTSKRRIARLDKKALGAVKLIARNEHAVVKIEESIGKLDGSSHLFKTTQKRFLEFKKKSAARQNKILHHGFKSALAKVATLEEHDDKILDSRNTPKGA